MRKLLIFIIICTCAYPAFTQSFKMDGAAKTGLLWTKSEDRIHEPIEGTRANSKDDAGNGQGRFRLSMEYSFGNFGIKLRLDWDNWDGDKMPALPYAFGYGNFFNDQFTVSLGKLGASPWGTGGPEMWKELEIVKTGGIRLEYKPAFVPGLNVGVVINGFNQSTEDFGSRPVTLLHILQESVLGASYTHEYFLARFAYRFDSEADTLRGISLLGKEGDDFIYRVEERILKNYIPGFQIWALGAFNGLWCAKENLDDCYVITNWLFIQYAPELFTAQIRFGYDVISTRQIVHIKPSFHLNLLNKLIKVGASFWYGQDFGEFQNYPGSPFSYIEVEPLIQVNFAANAYITFAYNWRLEYGKEGQEHIDRGIKPITQIQWINLRFGLTF